MNGPNWERVLKVDPQSRLLKGKWTDKVPELGHQSFVRSSVFCQVISLLSVGGPFESGQS